MSAVKVIFKRSSLLGKRPTGQNLEAGEIALNTNSNDPGLFFEVNDGSVSKVGPTAYLSGEPTGAPSLGELWVDRDTKALSIGTDLKTWQAVGTPFLGGTAGLTVFVAPEYPNATDSLANDGQTVPFITLNRAVLEVTKNVILDTLSGVSLGNNRYLIVLAPGQHCVVNRPGPAPSEFNLDLTDSYQEVTQDVLAAFNPETVGGLVLPRGVSIIGLDLKKCEVHPTYVPKYTHPAFLPGYQQTVDGPVYENQPLSSVFRWTGNTYLSNFTGFDKVESRVVTRVTVQEDSLSAVFSTNRPHGLDYNDFVQVTYSDSADQVGATFSTGQYYVYPLNSYEFLLSVSDWSSATAAAVLASTLPQTYFLPGVQGDPKFNVGNVYPYYVPPLNEEYELHSYSHHRLSLVKNATLKQLNNYYTKVQKAFPNLFAGQVNTTLASTPETVIVAPASASYPDNLSTNSTDNSSPYQNTVNLRSDYGFANGDYDGNLVSGFKSVIVNASTCVSLQKDPVAYEVYSTSSQNWQQLTELTQQLLGGSLPLTSVPSNEQLAVLNSSSIPNIRYYYKYTTVTDPNDGLQKSTGLVDRDNDFRHFGFRVRGSNSFLQSQSVFTIGPAVACWALDGAIMSLTNSTTNFGSVAFQADGFSGIGTLGGANDVNKGFLLSGVYRPLRLLEDSVVSDKQKRILYLGSKVIDVKPDPNDPAVQWICLQRSFDPASILPFSLKPGSAIYTSDGTCTYRAFFVTDGTPTVILSAGPSENVCAEGGAILRVRKSDSTIPEGASTDLDIPFIRRFIDPRSDSEKSYGFYVQSTSPTSQAPQLGSVLRLNQTGQNLSNSIKRNYQFDPGQYGGVSQVFTVDAVETEQFSVSPNFNYKVADSLQSTNYVIYSTLTDASTPWVQSVPSDFTDLDSSLTPFYNPQGSYVTANNKNYYAAENNLWTSLYYRTTYNPTNGPTKVSPEKSDSPFVVSSVLERTELVQDTWQGLVPDPYYDYYVNGVPSPYKENLSYMRGAVLPYTEFALGAQVDDDDSSPDFGIIFKRVALDANPTVLVEESVTVQTQQLMTSPFVANPTFGRPLVAQLKLLSVHQVVLPQEGVSVLQLTNDTLDAVEYVRVISLNSNTLRVIRNYYPEYSQGTLPTQWPKGTVAKVCVSSGFPEPSVYDPFWSPTKSTLFRFFQLMGYAPGLVSQYLVPQYSGERLLLNASVPLSPINGYANLTTAWPVEFNNPSTVLANTHTWQYAGYFEYSRGLPKYQVNALPKKLSYDFQSMATWGGRLTVTGVNEEGQLVFSGQVKEALTAQFFSFENPVSAAVDRQTFKSPDPLEFPNPVLVYSADDITSQFNGTNQVFNLTRGGFSLPTSQLQTNSIFVTLGGVVQRPYDAYSIQGESQGNIIPQIVFSEPPPENTTCDIRIVTSDDDEDTMSVVTFTLDPAFDSLQNTFAVLPENNAVTNLNSFVFLSGVEQNPFGVTQTSSAYAIDNSGGTPVLSFIGGTPQEKTLLDMRGILSAERYQKVGISTVFVSSVDDIATLFDGTQRTFPLTINGEPVDPNKVNAENMFVSLGGVMQIPVAQEAVPTAGLAYSVSLNVVTKALEITFSTPPLQFTTCNIRVVTSEEFLTCPIPEQLFDTTLRDGPGITVNANNQITDIDSGLIN